MNLGALEFISRAGATLATFIPFWERRPEKVPRRSGPLDLFDDGYDDGAHFLPPWGYRCRASNQSEADEVSRWVLEMEDQPFKWDFQEPVVLALLWLGDAAVPLLQRPSLLSWLMYSQDDDNRRSFTHPYGVKSIRSTNSG